MKIFLLAPNFSPEFIGCGKYSKDIADVLTLDGHDVTVLTGNPHYPNTTEFQSYDIITDNQFDFDLVRVVNNLGRFKGLFGKLYDALSYGFGVYNYFRKNDVKSIDSVLVIAPYIFTMLFLGKLIKNKIPIRLHIQDNELLYIERKFKFLSKVSLWLQRVVLNRATNISTISQGMANLIKNHCENREVNIIRNWADKFDGNTFLDRRQEFQTYYPDLFADLMSHKKAVIYSGNIGQKQGLEICASALDIFREMDAVLIFVGDGSGLTSLKKLFESNSDIVKFHPFVKFRYLDILLKSANLALVPQLKSVEDLVFPSKLHNILASDVNVLVGCSKGTELYELQNYDGKQMYWTYAPEEEESFVAALRLCLDTTIDVNAQKLVQNEMQMTLNVRKILN
jgi:colanic acid biosynthesis glycosyl transferase WcaI